MRVAINYATWKTPRVYARCMAFSIWHDLKFIARTPTISRKIRYKWYIVIEIGTISFEGFSSEGKPSYQSLFTSYNRGSFFLSFFFLSDQKGVTKVWPLCRVTVTPVEREGNQQRARFRLSTKHEKRKKKKNRRPFICTGRLSNSPS